MTTLFPGDTGDAITDLYIRPDRRIGYCTIADRRNHVLTAWWECLACGEHFKTAHAATLHAIGKAGVSGGHCKKGGNHHA